MRIVSAKVRKSKNVAYVVVEKSREADVFDWQEIPVDREGMTFTMEGYVMIGGVAEIGGERDAGINRKSVIEIMVHDRWKGLMRVIGRKGRRIGIGLVVEGGKRLRIWSIYVEQGEHKRFRWREEEGNKVVIGDVNVKSEKWGGDRVGSDRGGRCIKDWMDRWGYRIGMLRGELTRVSERSWGSDSVIDGGVGMRIREMDGRIRDRAIGIENKALEMDVRMVDWRIEKKEKELDKVDWERVKEKMKKRNWRVWENMLEKCGREILEEVVEGMEGWLKKMVREERGRRR